MIKLNAKRILFILIGVLFLGICACQQSDTITTPKKEESPDQGIIANMTLEEKELKAFAKTGLLGPGESQTLSFVMDSRSLASF